MFFLLHLSDLLGVGGQPDKFRGAIIVLEGGREGWQLFQIGSIGRVQPMLELVEQCHKGKSDHLA